MVGASDFFIYFQCMHQSVRSPEPTWCFYFISNARFFFTFLLLRCACILPNTVPASSPSLFDLHLHLILLHFTFFCSRRLELRFERFSISSPFELHFLWSCALILSLPFSFALLILLLYWAFVCALWFW